MCCYASHLADQVEVEPDALALVAHDRAGAHRAAQRAVERRGEQRLRRADRIGRVDDDDVVLVGFALDILGRVLVDERQPRVAERRRGRRAQVLARDLAHLRVDLAHRDPLDAGVPAHLAQHAAVAAADDEHRARVRVAVQRQVRDHLLVGVLVALRQLDHAVEHEHRAVRRRAEHEDVLEVGPRLVQHLLDLEAHRLARPHHLALVEPAVLDRHCCGLCVAARWRSYGRVRSEERRRRRQEEVRGRDALASSRARG